MVALGVPLLIDSFVWEGLTPPKPFFLDSVRSLHMPAYKVSTRGRRGQARRKGVKSKRYKEGGRVTCCRLRKKMNHNVGEVVEGKSSLKNPK